VSDYVIPATWTACKLGDVLDYGSPRKAEPAEIPNDAWILELEDIEKDTSKIIQRQTFAERQSKSTKNQFLEGDVLYGKLRPYLNKVVRADRNGYCTTEIVPIRAPAGIDGGYLFYWLKSQKFLDYVNSVSHGVNMPRLGTKEAKAAPFLLAPLSEQKRIADKLDTLFARVDACRDRLARIPTILKRFRQSVLAAATGGELTQDWRDQTSCTEIWTETELGRIAEITGGVTKDAKKQSATDEEVPYLRVANVQRGYLDLAEIKKIRVPAKKLTDLLLEPGDVLFNEGGDIDKLGRGWIWEGQIARCTFQNHVFRARLRDKTNHPKYVSWWGNYRGLEYFLRSGKQTTNLASINKSMLSALPISLPPADEQYEIVRRVESLLALADQLEARYTTARAQADRLTPALLAKAFRGELVPQHAGDERADRSPAPSREQSATPQTPARARQNAQPDARTPPARSRNAGASR